MTCVYCGQEISRLANGSTVCTSSANVSEPDTVGNKHHVTLALRDLNEESKLVRQMMRDGDTEGLAAYANAGNKAKAKAAVERIKNLAGSAESGVEMGKVNRVEESHCKLLDGSTRVCELGTFACSVIHDMSLDDEFKGMATDEKYQAVTKELLGSAETGGEKAAEVLKDLMQELGYVLDMGGTLTLPVQIQMKKASAYLDSLVPNFPRTSQNQTVPSGVE